MLFPGCLKHLLSFSCAAGCCRSGKGYGTCSSEGQMWWNGEAASRSASIDIAPVLLHHFSRIHVERLSLFLLTCSMGTLRLLPWQQHLLLHQQSARYDTSLLCRICTFMCRSNLLWKQQFLVRLRSVRRSGNHTKPPKISLFLHNLRARSLHLLQLRPWQQPQSRPLAVMRYIITCIEKAYCLLLQWNIMVALLLQRCVLMCLCNSL